ncbi:MAG: hypothetical protein LQ349_000417 [Xanthoria aureola]|nr:MAG: hypothetical protein LQ349_000417 [Xanthoria aureola]
MPLKAPGSSEPRTIVVIGGGVIGCSTAYFLTRHGLYNPQIHSVVILEASRIAGGSSGKAGGLLAEWATPKCLAPLSFKTHGELAKEHGGDKIWGHRSVYCADVALEAHDWNNNNEAAIVANGVEDGHEASSTTTEVPSDLDWLLPGSVKSYTEAGNPHNSGQVNPLAFTETLAQLAKEKGAEVIIGSATAINYRDRNSGISSVSYTQNGTSKTLNATDVLLAAGPWTPKLFPAVNLSRPPRGHSVVVRPSRDLSPYVLFPNISARENGNNLLSPEIYPRPGDKVHGFDTVYACGPDDYEVPLPDSTDTVAVDEQKCNEVYAAVGSVSKPIHEGEVLTKQACYKAQIRAHAEDEEVGPIVGPTGIQGLWLATGHDEWGIQNAPGTGLVMSEMIFEGAAHSADCESLAPKHFLKRD